MNVLVYVLGVAFVAGAHGNSVELPLCSEEYCYDVVGDCTRPNEPNHGVLIDYNAPAGDDRLECYCFCGKTNGQNCTHDNECIEGFECVITRAHAENTVGRVETGLCHSKCERMESAEPGAGGCTPYEKCTLEGKIAFCKSRPYACSSAVQGMGVEGVRMLNGQQTRINFQSPCFLHERNRELQEENPIAPLFQMIRFID